MNLTISTLFYFIGAILSILSLFVSKSSIPSFFSRGRILQSLRDENQDLNDALKKLRKRYFSDYNRFILLIVLVIFIVVFGYIKIRFTLENGFFILYIVYLGFVFFNMVNFFKLTSLFKKNVDKITDSLRKIVDRAKMSETAVA